MSWKIFTKWYSFNLSPSCNAKGQQIFASRIFGIIWLGNNNILKIIDASRQFIVIIALKLFLEVTNLLQSFDFNYPNFFFQLNNSANNLQEQNCD